MEPPEHVINHPSRPAIQGEPPPPRPSSTNPGTFEDLKQSPRTKSCVSLLMCIRIRAGCQNTKSESNIRIDQEILVLQSLRVNPYVCIVCLEWILASLAPFRTGCTVQYCTVLRNRLLYVCTVLYCTVYVCLTAFVLK